MIIMSVFFLFSQIMSNSEVLEKEAVDMEVSEKVADLEKEISSREGFTSDQFKIEIQNLPRFFGIGQYKKLFVKKNITFHKIKPCGKNATYMFVNFKNAEDRDKAIDILNGFELKGRKLRAFKAKPPKDPMLKKLEDNVQGESKLLQN